MKYDLSQDLKNFKGDSILEMGSDNKPCPMKVYDVIMRACLFNDETLKDPKIKLEQYKLAQKCKPEITEFSVEELVKIKALANQTYGVLVYGALEEFFDKPEAS